MTKRIYGWTKDTADARDFFLLPDLRTPVPARVDLRGQCPPVYDQGHLGSCTANAIAAAHELDQMKQPGGSTFVPSRLGIYYGERKIEGTVSQDSGAMIRDGMKVINSEGVVSETLWPYIVAKFAQKPPAAYYAEAAKHQSILYQRVVPTIDAIKAALAAGYPVVFGFKVYASFESQSVAKTGIVPVPKKGEQLLGGHAVCAVGYDDAKGWLIVRNSWGPGWGDKGYFYFPYANIAACGASDFWTLTKIEEA